MLKTLIEDAKEKPHIANRHILSFFGEKHATKLQQEITRMTTEIGRAASKAIASVSNETEVTGKA